MALSKKINNRAITDRNTGFGDNTSSYGGRFINKNGNSNIEKSGINFLDKLSWFHTMLSLSRSKFLAVIITEPIDSSLSIFFNTFRHNLNQQLKINYTTNENNF